MSIFSWIIFFCLYNYNKYVLNGFKKLYKNTTMIHKTKQAINTMVEKHKHVMREHKDMMWVHVFLALIVWVFLHMLFPPIHSEANEEAITEKVVEQVMIEHFSPTLEADEAWRIQAWLLELLNNPSDGFRTIPDTITAPELSLKLMKDKKEWFTMFLWVENFAFTPKKLWIDGDVDYFEWHATLYINDQYISRIYWPHFHIPNHYLNEWDNVILVTLNDNNHQTFMWHEQIIYDADIINY